MSQSAIEQLSPAFPQRAPWGTAAKLRAWQLAALEQYQRDQPRDFLAVATPGAGKTTFALRIAGELLANRTVEKVIVVCPTEHLKVQWAEAAARVGIHLDPGLGGHSRNGRARSYDGLAVTYAGVAAKVWHYAGWVQNFRTLVIFDEIHHAGDALSWGEAVLEAFELATRRLALTGTPFRSDDNPIPFISYEILDGGVKQSRPDYSYTYADALSDHVVRPVLFMSYGGPMRWKTKAGDELACDLGEPLPKDLTSQAWRTALDPHGQWINAVLQAADLRLNEVRRHIPDAGGLVIASNQSQARSYARLLEKISGEKPVVVLSDDQKASLKIDSFSAGQQRWMVAVRMVSEGVDIPRLMVGVYATATQTPLFFAQAVGRFVRTRRRGELATVFVPNVPVILAHAAALEKQRDHVIGKKRDSEDLWSEEEVLLRQAQQERTTPSVDEGSFELVESNAVFDHALFDSQDYGLVAEPHSQDEADYLALPGMVDAAQLPSLLAERQRRQMRRQERRDRKERIPREEILYRQLADKRKRLNSLVSQYARISGRPHSHVHADLRRQCGGPALAQCEVAHVDERIAMILQWLGR